MSALINKHKTFEIVLPLDVNILSCTLSSFSSFSLGQSASVLDEMEDSLIQLDKFVQTSWEVAES